MVAASANFQSIRCARISFEHITQREFDVLSGLEPRASTPKSGEGAEG